MKLDLALSLLEGIDPDTGLTKVHPDNFLTKEQISAVNELVQFVHSFIPDSPKISSFKEIIKPALISDTEINGLVEGICVLIDDVPHYPYTSHLAFNPLFLRHELVIGV